MVIWLLVDGSMSLAEPDRVRSLLWQRPGDLAKSWFLIEGEQEEARAVIASLMLRRAHGKVTHDEHLDAKIYMSKLAARVLERE